VTIIVITVLLLNPVSLSMTTCLSGSAGTGIFGYCKYLSLSVLRLWRLSVNTRRCPISMKLFYESSIDAQCKIAPQSPPSYKIKKTTVFSLFTYSVSLAFAK